MALGPGGKIVEQGSYETLLSHDGYVSSLGLSSEHHEEDKKPEDLALAIQHVVARKADDDTQQELARKTGDSSVYRYYVMSIGWKLG